MPVTCFKNGGGGCHQCWSLFQANCNCHQSPHHQNCAWPFSACSCSMISTQMCWLQTKENVKVTPINSDLWACGGIGVIKIHMDTGNSANVKVLGVPVKLLGFNLLLWIDAIKALGDIYIILTETCNLRKRNLASSQNSISGGAIGLHHRNR